MKVNLIPFPKFGWNLYRILANAATFLTNNGRKHELRLSGLLGRNTSNMAINRNSYTCQPPRNETVVQDE